MYRSARHTALLIALLLKRSGKRAIRVSERTFKKLGDRDRIRSAFVVEVQLEAMSLGVILAELNRGGFGATWASSLEGAPSVTAKTLIPLADRNRLDENAILKELDLKADDDDDE